ncbi:hypothetical protein LA080_005035 [Diaporthe eres]|nr:hypothetical protein LA080_005035 [Diaporthe eres]
MASQFFVLALASSVALAQDMDSMPAGHEMSVTGDGNSVTAAEPTTAEHATAEPTTASQALEATTPLPTAIMPSDVSDVSGTPTTLVVDTQTPPSPSSSMSWAITTTHNMGQMTHANASGVAEPTGGASPSGTGGAGDSVDNVNSAVRSAFNKISIGILALCFVASAALQIRTAHLRYEQQKMEGAGSEGGQHGRGDGDGGRESSYPVTGRPGLNSSHPAVLKSPVARSSAFCNAPTRPHSGVAGASPSPVYLAPIVLPPSFCQSWAGESWVRRAGQVPDMRSASGTFHTSTLRGDDGHHCLGFGVGFMRRPTNTSSPPATWLLALPLPLLLSVASSPPAGPAKSRAGKAVLGHADLKILLPLTRLCAGISISKQLSLVWLMCCPALMVLGTRDWVSPYSVALTTARTATSDLVADTNCRFGRLAAPNGTYYCDSIAASGVLMLAVPGVCHLSSLCGIRRAAASAHLVVSNPPC